MYDIFTCIKSEFVNSARVVVVFIDRFRLCILLYCVCVFECNVYVGMFEEVGEFSNFWTVVCEGCRFFSSLSCVWWTLLFHAYFLICYEMLWEVIVMCHAFYCIPLCLLSFYY